ncbi:hypothetical protein LMOSLCC5850_0471 [Listeria monocytogenes SLCC5850]|nr:hypothetical protein LMOf6854_0512 [Listeria monocytogenes str. 1/2a F6854] [Listeria monocytogenes serotype 1/2a str. F6854]EFF97409.1 predicted protein [Listeria monocytogenes J2818]CBY50940.1 hypothetical protein LMOSLCC5850_0471 [Listeria monocytogenes SLCC5850]CBY59656.1 hypothetical protein LMOSLCC7179_0450 [Listeria monocytogenes SLCC7179]
MIKTKTQAFQVSSATTAYFFVLLLYKLYIKSITPIE